MAATYHMAMTTALVYTDEYLRHETGRHPERKERYEVTLDALQSDANLWQELLKLSPRPATDEEISHCHKQQVLDQLVQACQTAPAALDADTVVSRDSEHVARLAAGGACSAIDSVMSGAADNAFVACRPPGHRAGGADMFMTG